MHESYRADMFAEFAHVNGRSKTVQLLASTAGWKEDVRLLLKLDAVGAGVWILFCLEVVNAESKAPQHVVAQLLELAQHLVFELLLALLHLGCVRNVGRKCGRCKAVE
eukprot:350555-Chlamydomonas_euryale.AAC.1